MKVAISTDGASVSMHFGRCPSFTLVDFDDAGNILSKEHIDNPGHHPGFLPQFLSEKGVHCVIAGGAGQRAQGLFAEKNIQLILGISGQVEETIHKIAKGELEGGESLCQPGRGKGYGLDKTECDHPEGHSD
jgi:predicted Fe-Mo cluster-binding NifX family protein